MCLQSAAPAWYARILSTVSAFHFSDTCYFTFKLGHQWRTEELFLHSNFLGWRKGGLCIPSGGKSLPVYVCVNFNDKYTTRNHKVRPYWTAQLFKTKHALVSSFFPSLTTTPQGWSSHSFTTSSVRLLPVLTVFWKNIKYSQWSVGGFCLVGLYRFQRSSGGSTWLQFPREKSRRQQKPETTCIPRFQSQPGRLCMSLSRKCLIKPSAHQLH